MAGDTRQKARVYMGDQDQDRPVDPDTTPSPSPDPGSVTGRLRSGKGIRGDLSLPSEELPRDAVAGPTSEKRYSLLGEIARGGMGAIVRLVDNDIRRPVAMKVILGDESEGTAEGDRERVERFVEEAQVTGQLEHPNIVPVHELGLDPEGKVYFTMKLVRGESLESVLDRIADKDGDALEAYPLSHLLQIFLKICDALAFAHSKGVLHRDLKPENVMVGSFGEVLVMDWGLARVKGREDTARDELVRSIRSEKAAGRTLEGQVMGTPAYMPPEQARGHVDEIDERSDVFALGGILYRLLTHEAPYSGDTAMEALRKAMAGNVIPPRRRTPWNRIPKELESVCLKAMAREREGRYGTVEELAGDVRSFLDHRLVGAHRYGWMSRVMRFVQRHPTGSVSGGVALVLLGAGAAVSGVAFGEARAYRARAREKEVERAREAERAELESYRRMEAERGRKAAVGQRDEARDNLVKGRRVAALLRAAEAELGKAHLELKRVCNSPASREERRACWDKWAPRIEAFERGVAEDAASQATWHALKGWLLRHGAQEKEAFGEFAKARKADPDVTYGWLFEAMVRLSEYLDVQPLPGFTTETGVGITFDDPPAETALMRLVREYFERLMEEVSSAAVWGESSSRDLKEVLEGLKRLQEGEHREAE
ncbi:MAG: serine/threonine-protein kinase, partial [Planctomycetota bacterium]